MFIDEVEITVKAGNGGNGAISFKRNAQTPKGGPDGGNGGNGGSIFIKGDSNYSDLREFRFKKYFKAEDGIAGSRNNLFGRNGKDLVIKVPFGTKITQKTMGETFEIEKDTEPILIVKGGTGGRGNNEFKTSTNQTPRYAEKGEQGEEKELFFELRLIAQIGFIGLPNSGKSSLLKELTNAQPKIGSYPFTTLEPNLGSLDGLIIADIPGLIEGASSGKGLGIKFLRHIEKTRLLAHCIDSTSKDVLKDYQTVKREFEKYSKELMEKEEIILLTKTDLINKDELIKKVKLMEKLKKTVKLVSIHDFDSINKLKEYFTTLFR